MDRQPEIFEQIKKTNEPKEACENSGQSMQDHFPRMEKMVGIGSGATRDIGDLNLTRYACYLIIQNANPSNDVVALGQTYFAVQTRKQELLEDTFEKLGSE